MSVLVDTSVWSLAFRRGKAPSNPRIVTQLTTFITQGQARIIGPVRQELLSGVKVATQFALLRDRLRAFPDIPLDARDYEEAAEFSNRCRGRGIQGSPIDFLICAVASRRQLAIFTTDRDFEHFSAVLEITLLVIEH